MRRATPVLVLALCIAGTAAGMTLGALSSAAPDPGQSGVTDVLLPVALLAFPIVGALIASRHPRNAVGWLFLALGLLHALGVPADAYYRYEPGPLPGAPYAAWVMHWTVQSPAIFVLFASILLLFPDGRFLSGRWRRLGLVTGLATALFLLLIAFKPGGLAETHPPLENPVAVAWLAGVWAVMELPLTVVVFGAVPVAAVGFVLRYRRSSGVQRQQLKWFSFAAVTIGFVIGLAPVVFTVEALWWMWPLLFLAGTTSIPLAAGAGILRYRLYDIDRIISRTLSYAMLVALLGGVYLGAVVGLGAVLRPVTGGNDLSVAASTLLAAAAFRPLNRRLRSLVDRRFNRLRYDAVRTVDAFAARLRNEIDINTLMDDVESVIRRTMAPSTVSFWIRPSGR